MALRVLVCGGRTFNDWLSVENVLSDIWEYEAGRWLTIIHGNAPGADDLAKRFGEQLHDQHGGDEPIAFPADWRRFGRAAGPIRNKEMLEKGKPDLVVAFMEPSGPGTAHMIKIARAAGVPVRVIPAREDYVSPPRPPVRKGIADLRKDLTTLYNGIRDSGTRAATTLASVKVFLPSTPSPDLPHRFGFRFRAAFLSRSST